LERRLRSRGTETEEAIQARLGVADRELEKSGLYQYQVQNDVVSQAVDAIGHILQDEGLTHD
jgi:guanylate kinase